MGVWIVWNLEPLASGGQSGPKLVPHVICQVLYAWEKTLNEDLYRGSSANLPRLHTCENKVPFWDFSRFSVTLCWGFKWVQEEIPSEEASTLQIGSVAFPLGEYNSQQLHPCHRLLNQDGHQDSSSTSLQSRPCSLWLVYSLRSRKNLEAVTRQLRRWKRLWRRSLTRSHKSTSMGPSRSCWNGRTSALQPEEIASNGTRVSCVYYQ